METLWYYLQKGVFHVLNLNAYEHILFLIVLTVPFLFEKWKRVFLLITSLVLAHLLSSILRVYDVVSVNKGLIELLILITILSVAVYNIFTSGKRAQTEKFGLSFFAAVFFGALHGFGFLRNFNSIHNSQDNKLLAMLEFSVGIWIGLFIVGFVSIFIGFLFQTVFRFSKRDWVMVISAMVIGILLPMLIGSGYIS